MPSDTYTELLVDESPAARRTSLALVIVAVVALAGDCLLNSPGRFSERHFEDTSLLRPVVTALALDARFPTERGVEIRNLFFFSGAALLGLIAAVRLVSSDRQPRMASDDLLNFRRRAGSPYFWWALLLLASVLSSTFAHAPDVCQGQTIVRFLHLAWWLPLAALLSPRHVRALMIALLAALALTAAVGLWYYRVRNLPNTALSYPMGNELLLAACLLPGVFVAAGLLAGALQPLYDNGSGAGRRPSWLVILPGLAAAFVLVLAALALTHSRSAFAGLAAGVFAVLFYATAKTARRAVLLVAVVSAIVGVSYVQNLREHGVMGQGGHSIRVRMNYAWPYALTLFMQKPVLGHGDGSYSLLAGKFARDDQIEDPRTINFDEWSWIGRTDNEYLQLLSEVGLVGMAAFVVALVLTLRRALLYCDLLRSDPSLSAYRWFILSLAAAVVAMAVEQGGSPALREPGLPPIFLTVWAGLWVLVRIPIHPPEPVAEERRMSNATLRFGGILTGVAAAILGYFGVRDWQGNRANYEARVSLGTQQFADAISQADFAGEHVLDPLYRIHSKLRSVAARTGDFSTRLATTDLPPTMADVAVGQEALGRLSTLSQEAPRFLRISRLKAELWWNLGLAHSRLGQRDYERESLRQAALAWMEHRADEPFSIEAVDRAWRVLAIVAGSWERLGGRPEELQELFRYAGTRHRLDWLRCLLRNGEFDLPITRWFTELTRQPDFLATLNQMFQQAAADAQNPALRWTDRLAPETFRLAAMAKSLAGQPEESVGLAAAAAAMYQHASPGLFPSHAAALHEIVRYSFNVDPLAHLEQNLKLLSQAQTILESPADENTPLPAPLGLTRLRLLLAAGREDEAAAQVARLTLPGGDGNGPATEAVLGAACLDLARAFANDPARPEEAVRWARQAMAQVPSNPDAWGVLVQAYLRQGAEDSALAAAERLLELAPAEERGRVHHYLGELETDFLGSPIWPALRERSEDFPPRPLAGPPEPPADEAGAPATSAGGTASSETDPTTAPRPVE